MQVKNKKAKDVSCPLLNGDTLYICRFETKPRQSFTFGILYHILLKQIEGIKEKKKQVVLKRGGETTEMASPPLDKKYTCY